MSVYRSYFSKNNTLIESNLTNNSQNPVTEISYGTIDKQVSRFLFDVDFSGIRERIAQGSINPNNIVKHVLHMTNTIAYAPQFIGKKSYSTAINRAAAFNLDVFNVTEDWQEGNGYNFTYAGKKDVYSGEIVEQASNWTARTSGVRWSVDGAYISGVSEIIGNQAFAAGNEDIEIDVTEYINQRLFGTGYTGTTAYSGDSFGLGIKFPDNMEAIQTSYREAVAFHAKHTNTFYEPFIETIIADEIRDDRNYFYMDKANDLYLYVNIGNFQQNIIVNKVDIYDYEDNLINTLSGSSIIHVSKGVYKINYFVDSSQYPDAVIFRDVWSLTVNSRNTEFKGEFYLISADKYYNFDLSNQIDFKNYFFYFWGINEKENIRAGNIRKIRLSIKELYANQSNFLPLDLEYRLFTTVGAKYEIDIIPFTSVNRTSSGYEFDLDTSWLIPQDYYLQIRLKNGRYYENKQTLSFTVVNNGISY